MPAAARMGIDVAGGVITSGAATVIINGAPAARVSDTIEGHAPGMIHSAPTIATGSPVVRTEGSLQSKEGDVASCNHVISTGSPNVMVGAQPYQVFVILEPGLMLIGGSPVYDDSKEGQAAKKRDETYVANDHETGESVSPSGTVPVSIPTNPPAVSTEPLEDIDVSKEAMGKYVSKYFTLADAGMLIADQPEISLSSQQIANNWKGLCVNVLDALYEKYRFKGDKGKVNSGFRTVKYNRSIGSSDSSDHCKGCAADITVGSPSGNAELFRYIIASGLPFSQVIFEGRWVHIAYNGKPQSVTRVMYTMNGKAPYTHCGYNGQDLPPTWTA